MNSVGEIPFFILYGLLDSISIQQLEYCNSVMAIANNAKFSTVDFCTILVPLVSIPAWHLLNEYIYSSLQF